MSATEHFKVVAGTESVRVIELTLPPVLDGKEFDVLNEDMLGAIDKIAAGRWVIDLSNVNYLGSSMLGMLVNVRQRVKQSQGALVLCCMSDRLLNLIEACSLERLFKICRTRADAIRLASRG